MGASDQRHRIRGLSFAPSGLSFLSLYLFFSLWNEGEEREEEKRGNLDSRRMDQLVLTGGRRGQYSDAVLSELENQNEAQIEGMSAKVRMLKDVRPFPLPSLASLHYPYL